MQVLKGAQNTIKRSKPVIVFEHGLGASEHYGTTPEDLHLFLTNECGLRISTMDGFLKSESNLEIESFSKQFHKGENYYFVAHA